MYLYVTHSTYILHTVQWIGVIKNLTLVVI